jgi:hypothetical protein
MLRLAQQKEREGASIPGRCSSPAKGWAKTWRVAPPLAQSSPPGKEDQGRRVGEKGKVEGNRDEPEDLSREGESRRGLSVWRR